MSSPKRPILNRVKIPKGYFGKIHSRSSSGMQFTDVGGGVIDSNERGPVSVVFFNFSSRYFEVKEVCANNLSKDSTTNAKRSFSL